MNQKFWAFTQISYISLQRVGWRCSERKRGDKNIFPKRPNKPFSIAYTVSNGSESKTV